MPINLPLTALLDRLVSRLTRRRTPESQDARLSRLAEEVALSREELREVRAKLPPSSINYDEERELPYRRKRLGSDGLPVG